MRIWTLHPRYLDGRGLVALWREALLAQKVLKGQTVGYRHHPQLSRFRAQADPVAAIAAYLIHILAEAEKRGYRFNGALIEPSRVSPPLQATRGQLLYEWEHLKAKLEARSPLLYRELLSVERPEPHPLFVVVEGEVEPWEVPRA